MSGHAAEALWECIVRSPMTLNAATTETKHALCAAEMYGNQDEIGNALAKLMKEGVVKREDVWITSKACTPCQHFIQAASGHLKRTSVPRD